MAASRISLIFIIFVLSSSLMFYYCNDANRDNTAVFPDLTGPYLGQSLPGDEPELFAPGIISTAMYNRDITFTPDGNEIYFCVSTLGYNLIFYTKQKNGRWTEPCPAPFITNYENMYYEPHITADGKQLFFLSDMPVDENVAATQDIWAVDRQGDTWGKPYNLGTPINSDGNEYYPSTTKDGTMYFTRAEKGSRINFIYRSKYVDGKYQEPEKLGPNVNCGTNRYNAFIDPQERFIIIPAVGMEDALGGTDYYISFHDAQDNWSKPQNMGPKINQEQGAEWSSSLSPDGKYFFFMSSRRIELDLKGNDFPSYAKLQSLFKGPLNGNSNVFWMKADFIDTFREQ